MSLSRRQFLKNSPAFALTAGLAVGESSAGVPQSAVAPQSTVAKSPPVRAFPKNFLWGTATAGHQVEGNNVNSDYWFLEHLPSFPIFKEPSGDACDHYHLYPTDISMLAALGFNAYRFSVEWSRIEPAEGAFSRAELEHYRRMLAACKENHLTTLVTYSHFTAPLWFSSKGGWESTASADLFARFCERTTRHLGDLVDFAATFNEPGNPYLLRWFAVPQGYQLGPGSASEAFQRSLTALRTKEGLKNFSAFMFGDPVSTRANMIAAHAKGKAAIKSVRSSLPVGLTLAVEDDQPVGSNSRIEEKRSEVYSPWIEVAKADDFLGVQSYTRERIADKQLPPPAGAEITTSGMEFYPEAIEGALRFVASRVGIPLIVTENGVATVDDERRRVYYRRALEGVYRAISSGIDVRGYVAWSLLDNFEWMAGYGPTYGLVAVDRDTQQRTIKPSAVMLGNIARANALP